jgi:hypothetical protein
MIDERAFLAQLESANTDELSQSCIGPAPRKSDCWKFILAPNAFTDCAVLLSARDGERYRQATSWSFTELWGEN